MDEEEKDLETLEPEGVSEEPPKEPVHWATRGERIIAWIGAIVVILITIAYTYSIFTGELFRH